MSGQIVYGDRVAGTRIAGAVGHLLHPVDAVISRHIGPDDELAGGIIYTSYTHESVSIHGAGFVPGWMTRFLLFIIFDYAFNQMKVNRVFAQVKEDNLLSLGFIRKVGFSPVAYVPGVFTGPVAMIISKMEREDCRWLELAEYYQREDAHGQRQRRTAAS